MPSISFPYGRGYMTVDIASSRLKAQLVSELHHYRPDKSEMKLILDAMDNPVGSAKLSVMAEGKQKVVILASDHTRPVPSKLIIPALLGQIRQGNPDADITILVGTGCHRGTTNEELTAKFGPQIMANEHIVVHDCDHDSMAYLGKLPSGGDLYINKIACDADLLVAEGFIEPHFFAGFSGGRKSVMPGVASRKTVLYNHNAEFIAHPKARTGVLDGNPIHEDMLYAAQAAKLSFICNVVINAEKKVLYAVAGDCKLAHLEGCRFLSSKCRVDAVPADIAITTNGGYPLDQNIYQSIKGMTAAEATVEKGGVIIMLAQSEDGHGAPEFHKTFAEEKDLDRMLKAFTRTPKDATRVDQWQSQIFARVLQHAAVIYVSDAPDDMVRDLHMTPASSLEEALECAERLLGNPNAAITAIPDGVAVIVT